MLIVTSNWAIADGTLVDPPATRRAERFHAEVRRSAIQAGFRQDGCYRPVERIEIVLAGDTFDWLLSDAWLGGSRPWRHARRSGPVLERVMARSLRCAARPLARLARIVRRGIAVPASDSRGRPVLGSETFVPVRTTLLTGDRDARLEEPQCRLLAGRWGLRVGGRWTNGTIAISHGDEFDPLCGRASGDAEDSVAGMHVGDRPPTLRESIVVDLLAEFGAMLREAPAGRDGGRRLIGSLAEVHPFDMPRRLTAWLQQAVDRGDATASVRDRIVAAWRRAVAEWHRRARREVPWSAATFDAVDDIAVWMEALDGAVGMSESAGGLDDLLDGPPAARGDAVRIAIFGHPSRRFTASAVNDRPVRICLGPRPVRRSSGMASLVRDSAVDVACVAPWLGGVEQEPRSVTVFEAGEGGGSETFVRAADQDAVSESQAGGRVADGVRIIDAA